MRERGRTGRVGFTSAPCSSSHAGRVAAGRGVGASADRIGWAHRVRSWVRTEEEMWGTCEYEYGLSEVAADAPQAPHFRCPVPRFSPTCFAEF